MSDVLPSGWALGKVPELAEILDSKRVPLNAKERAAKLQGAAVDTLVPYYGATGQVGLTVGHLFNEELVLLGEDGVPFLDPLRKKAYRISGRSWVNNHAHVLRARQGACDARFLEANLNSISYVGHVTGSTRLKLTQAAMNAMQLRVAPYKEQCRIADKLDTVQARVDAVNDRLARVAPLLKRFRQSVLAAAVSGDLIHDSTRRAESETHLLGAVLRRVQTGPFGSALHRSDYVADGIPLVNPMHIVNGRVVATSDMTVALSTASRLSEFRFTVGDVVIGRRGVMGRCAVIGPNEAGWLCGTGSMRLSPKPSLTPEYLQLFLSSPTTVAALEGESVGSTMINLNQKILLGLTIWLPPVVIQMEVVRRVELLLGYADRLEARLQAAQTAADRLTPALLAKAFRGELVPQDPNDEPASELLKRLAAARDTPASPRRGRGRKASADVA